MAVAPSPTLTRALRRGVVATTTVPQGGHVMRPLAPQGAQESQDTSELDRVFAGLNAGSMDIPDSAAQPAATVVAAVADGGAAEDGVRALSPVSASISPTAPARPRRRFELDPGAVAAGAHAGRVAKEGPAAASAPAPVEASMPAVVPRPRRRFGDDTGDAAAQPVNAASAVAQRDGGAPAASKAGGGAQTPSRSWSNLTRESDRVDVVSARKGMAAAKVLAPLVAAVSFRPGSAASSKDRSGSLAELLMSVHQNAVQTAEGISDALREDVPSWMVTQLMQAYASVMAKRWERGANVDPNSLGRAMTQVLGSGSEQAASLIRGASEDAYIEVDGPDVARYRIAVSVTSAAWALYDWVTHECLSVDASGNMPSEFYTYGLEASEIVNRLLVRCVDECRALVIQNDSADLRTAHMQASINRMSQLVGAEYVTQTRQIMNWIGEEGISQDEFSARLASATAELDTRILPHVFEWARVNFLRIEQGAFKTIEQLDEKAKAKRSPTEGGSAR